MEEERLQALLGPEGPATVSIAPTQLDDEDSVTVKPLDTSPEGLRKISEQFDMETQETRAEQAYKRRLREKVAAKLTEARPPQIFE